MRKKILYIPLDERPCNADYPAMMLKDHTHYTIISPAKNLLNQKKQPARVEQLWDFIYEHAKDSQAAIISIEMLCYGGLLPSRLHHLSETVLKSRLQKLVDLKQQQPQLKIYVSNLIMRTPQYSSSDEEPEYYGTYGHEIYRRSVLIDRDDRHGLTEAESAERANLELLIPEQHIEDYETRRRFNLEINKQILALVKNGVIDFLAIPQDDSAPYGYTARDQRVLSK
ncbi:MAG: DUF4127 family protein, partial [Culicoidibacterales bacterium]